MQVLQELTDHALMIKVKSGDSDKLGLLYERYKNKLLGFFLNMHHGHSLSEDMVQNVFLRILKYKHTYKDEGSFSVWVFRLARNISYDHFKKNKNERNTDTLSSLENEIEDSESLSSRIDSSDTILAINSAMQRLKPDQREVLILRKFKGMKFSDIAEVLGCSEGAAKVKAHRAFNELKVIFFQLEKNRNYGKG